MDTPAFDTPPVFNEKDLVKQMSEMKILMENLIRNQTPTPTPSAMDEPTTPKVEDYKPKLIEMLKVGADTGNFRWNGPEDNKYFEAIGAASGGSAIPEIWAKDVFRCCPYPASAFLYAPYIKWHEDIKGKSSREFISNYIV